MGTDGSAVRSRGCEIGIWESGAGGEDDVDTVGSDASGFGDGGGAEDAAEGDELHGGVGSGGKFAEDVS